MTDLREARARMVALQIERRGIRDARLQDAFRTVPREAFVPKAMAEFAYDDTPLPIAEGQTISQPYIVARTIDALGLRGNERVLEVGTGSGYAAAILGRVAREVYTIERHEALAVTAAERLKALGFDNVFVRCGDGTLGWSEHAPYDAIAVAAGGPAAPKALLDQLAIGGRLVIPIGPDDATQVLTRITRVSESRYEDEPLLDVRFVPLIGAQGWAEGGRARKGNPLSHLIREVAEPIDSIDGASIDALLERIGDARVVLIGEATHGSSEFYRMRARITRELVARRGFDFVAIEGDWPDAARVDDYVLDRARVASHAFTPFTRFPQWMWRNEEVETFVEWLRAHNATHKTRVGFHGLDLYSMFTSISVVLAYLDRVDPEAAHAARARYGLLTPWQRDPAAYGEAVLVRGYESAEPHVVAVLREMLARRLDYARMDGEQYFDAAQNARVVADAERYYRVMFYGGAQSWNLRDAHMFDTLRALISFYGPASKAIVWAHNSHVGDASATEMSSHGETNIGESCRAAFGERAYAIGFGTDHGVVAAAHEWDGPMEQMRVTPAHAASYERVFHDSNVPAFLMHLRAPRHASLRDELAASRLERAIGVVYRPKTELQSHYFSASLVNQFDEYVWFDETSSVAPLVRAASNARDDVPDTYPFGL